MKYLQFQGGLVFSCFVPSLLSTVFIMHSKNLPAEISSVYSYINPLLLCLGAVIMKCLNAAIAIGGKRYIVWIVLSELFIEKTRKTYLFPQT
jgi:hypothetical protein